MNRLIPRSIVSLNLLWLIFAAVCFSGCHSGAYMKADNTAGALQRAGTEVRAEVAMIDAATNSLADLISNPSGDLRIQFGRFTDSLAQLEKTARHAAARGPVLRKDGEAYFLAWDRQSMTLADEQIHQASLNRKSETVKLFDSTMQHYDEAQNNMNPLIGYLRDIHTALGADLTMSGLQAAKVPFGIAGQQANKARESLARTMGELDVLAQKMCFFAPPPQPAVK